MDTIRILVADDHPIVRDGLVAVLGTEEQFEITGQASNGVEVLNLLRTRQTDVVLLDLEMPEMDGVETLKQLAGTHPDVRAIVFTAFDTDERIVAAVEAGAKGYLLKGAPRDELFNAIRVVQKGESLLQPVVASKLMQHMSAQRGEHNVSPEALTEREMEVMHLLAQGQPNKEIAAKLFISERTVKFHVSSILGKLNAGNRTEAVTIAAQQGLVKLQ
ncbi:MAG: DNA-binding response regulator [Chloroflexi bacterium]|nr:MAG: DNA-binding response regulator [Chloroflexota bacterium]MBL1193639.1 DNA-binding response regulator [Chloroflexota bacterium]NOH10931.1 response regulator transcription factor [Chloroflexota bacterium]